MANPNWVKGMRSPNPKGRGYRPETASSKPRTLTQALRDKVNPDWLASLLIKRAQQNDKMLQYVYNRLEGMPRQSVDTRLQERREYVLTLHDGTRLGRSLPEHEAYSADCPVPALSEQAADPLTAQQPMPALRRSGGQQTPVPLPSETRLQS
jgi:hypothetical protein